MANVAQRVTLTPNLIDGNIKATWIWIPPKLVDSDGKSTNKSFLFRWGYNIRNTQTNEVDTANYWIHYDEDDDEGTACSQCTTTTGSNVYQNVVDIPDNAVKIWFHVRPVSTTYTVTSNDEEKEVNHWTAEWSTGVGWTSTASGGVPETPGAPSVSVNGYSLTATLESFQKDSGVTDQAIEFQCVVLNESSSEYEVYRTIKVDAKWQYASAVFDGLTPGASYKVRCRLIRDPDGVAQTSAYGEFSSVVSCIPAVMTGFKSIVATSSTSVRLSWDSVNTATSYEIEYGSDEQIGLLNTANDTFSTTSTYSVGAKVIHNNSLYECVTAITTAGAWDASKWSLVSNNVDSVVNSKTISSTTLLEYFEAGTTTTVTHSTISTCVKEISGLETGHTWYFRIRALNSSTGEGNYPAWSDISSVTLGLAPNAPTTWSSTTTAIIDESTIPTLFWIHNSRDNSKATESTISWTLDGVAQTDIVITHTESYEDDETPTYQYTFTSSQAASFAAGGIITWKVKTKGILNTYSEWSITRTIKLYVRPSVTLQVKSNPTSASNITTVTSFPFYILATATGGTQIPIGYFVSVQSLEDYTTINNIGEEEYVLANQTIYSQYFDSGTTIPDYSITSTYSIGDLVVYSNTVYCCNTRISTPEAWTAAHWTSTSISKTSLYIKMMPNNIDLKNDISYKIGCVANMDSGLTGENTYNFDVDWDEILSSPAAEIGYDSNILATHIRPYCLASDGSFDENVYLSIYRREYDGTFMEISSDLSNAIALTETYNAYSTYALGAVTIHEGVKYVCTTAITTAEAWNANHWTADSVSRYSEYSTTLTYVKGDIVKYRTSSTAEYKKYICIQPVNTPETFDMYKWEFDPVNNKVQNTTFVIDPHPSLDYARYRIVAVNESTGAVSFNDIPGYPVLEPYIVIQWDENWKDFDLRGPSSAIETPTWTGSMIKIPYNIDISTSYSKDVELVEYIGRSRPVTYYGTQLGETATWSVDIPKTDKDTLYALRRLAIWTGDVYVREPSGSGYWAKIDISFNINHKEVIIPISFNITRVEGGM